MINSVIISKKAMKALKSMPDYIVDKLETWIDAVERESLEED